MLTAKQLCLDTKHSEYINLPFTSKNCVLLAMAIPIKIVQFSLVNKIMFLFKTFFAHIWSLCQLEISSTSFANVQRLMCANKPTTCYSPIADSTKSINSSSLVHFTFSKVCSILHRWRFQKIGTFSWQYISVMWRRMRIGHSQQRINCLLKIGFAVSKIHSWHFHFSSIKWFSLVAEFSSSYFGRFGFLRCYYVKKNPLRDSQHVSHGMLRTKIGCFDFCEVEAA